MANDVTRPGSLVQRFEEIGIRHRIAQRGHVEIGMTDMGATEPPSLGDVNVVDGRRMRGPRVQTIQHLTRAVVHGQGARIVRVGRPRRGQGAKQGDTARLGRGVRQQAGDGNGDGASPDDGNIMIERHRAILPLARCFGAIEAL